MPKPFELPNGLQHLIGRAILRRGGRYVEIVTGVVYYDEDAGMAHGIGWLVNTERKENKDVKNAITLAEYEREYVEL